MVSVDVVSNLLIIAEGLFGFQHRPKHNDGTKPHTMASAQAYVSLPLSLSLSLCICAQCLWVRDAYKHCGGWQLRAMRAMMSSLWMHWALRTKSTAQQTNAGARNCDQNTHTDECPFPSVCVCVCVCVCNVSSVEAVGLFTGLLSGGGVAIQRMTRPWSTDTYPDYWYTPTHLATCTPADISLSLSLPLSLSLSVCVCVCVLDLSVCLSRFLCRRPISLCRPSSRPLQRTSHPTNTTAPPAASGATCSFGHTRSRQTPTPTPTQTQREGGGGSTRHTQPHTRRGPMRCVSKMPLAPSTVSPKTARPHTQQPTQTPPQLRITSSSSGSRRPPPHTRRLSTQKTPIHQPTTSSSSGKRERPSRHPTGQRPTSCPPPLTQTQTETRRPLPPSSAHRGATRRPPHWLRAAVIRGLWSAAFCWCWGRSMAWCASGGGHTHTAHMATDMCQHPVCRVAGGASSIGRMATIWCRRHSPMRMTTGNDIGCSVKCVGGPLSLCVQCLDGLTACQRTVDPSHTPSPPCVSVAPSVWQSLTTQTHTHTHTHTRYFAASSHAIHPCHNRLVGTSVSVCVCVLSVSVWSGKI